MNSLRYLTALLIGAVLTLTVVSCLKQETDTSVADMAYQLETASGPQAAGGPCDSVYFVPVAFGAEINMIPQTIASGNRKGVSWWQGKGFVFSRIDPTGYLQDKLKERMVFADTVKMEAHTKYFICRMVIK